VRDPVGPGDAGRRPFDANPRLQLVPAGVHHTNTETERPNWILPRRCVVCSGRCLARACCRRSVSQPAGSALRRASRSQGGHRMCCIRRSFVWLPPIHPLRHLTATAANLFAQVDYGEIAARFAEVYGATVSRDTITGSPTRPSTR
jgi:hypothetical protein